jgi:hypothetical protein
LGGGTGRIGRSESGHDDGDDNEAWEDEGSMGMKEKEVGVVSDCNKSSEHCAQQEKTKHINSERNTFECNA